MTITDQDVNGSRIIRHQLLASIALCAVLQIALVVIARADGTTQSLDLRYRAAVTVRDGPNNGLASVSAPGDINGDGHNDAVLGRCSARNRRDVVWALFGPFPRGRFHIDELESKGFRIRGTEPGEYVCNTAAVGDVNGDGLADIALGVERDADGSGAVYVVFGKPSTNEVSLRDFEANEQGAQGFRIVGPGGLALVGRQFDGAGDVNGDGLADLVLGSWGNSTYVVFGKTTTEVVDLASFEDDMQGVAGYRIDHPHPRSDNFFSVGGAGDVNGDSFSDVIIGNLRNTYEPGSAYVVFGKPGPVTVDARRPGVWGFAIRGPERKSMTGLAVSGAGDVNADGLADVIVASPYAYFGRRRGNAFVVFGKTDTLEVRLSDLAGGGFEILGKTPYDVTHLVHGVGDVNKDGRDDVLVAAHYARYRGRPGSGSAYIVYGKDGPGRVRLEQMGEKGYRIDGAYKDGRMSEWVDASDLTGDGCNDILLGGLGRHVYMFWGCRPIR